MDQPVCIPRCGDACALPYDACVFLPAQVKNQSMGVDRGSCGVTGPGCWKKPRIVKLLRRTVQASDVKCLGVTRAIFVFGF